MAETIVTESLPPQGPELSARGKPLMRTLADKRAIEATPLSEHYTYRSTVELMLAAAERFGDKPYVSFQLTGSPTARVTSLSFREVAMEAVQAANAFHALGVQPGETIATLLPNLPETVTAMLGAQALGVVNPINPMLEPSMIAGILEESGAKVLVTLAPFVKTDVAAKAAEAVAMTSGVRALVEIDISPYLGAAMRPVVRMMRPRRVSGHGARIVGYRRALRAQRGDRFAFQRTIGPDDVGALYHTGGTTGAPKLAQHSHRGMVFNGWMAHHLLFDADDVMLCALPLFHVFAAYPMAMAALAGGSHLVMVSPQGFRGVGVIDNFWKLVARHRATFLCAVPTAIAALDQRPVDADVSSLRYMISGSAPLPRALFERFERTASMKILEGYGMTEATCVTSCNPPDGERKVGSVGLPLPFVEARIALFDDAGAYVRDCATDEIGEICFQGPTVFPGYRDPERNVGLFFGADDPGGPWLRTGDLGRIDADGYIWITGRAKDLIIRGGHNIDPGMIEEALAQHPAVATVGAIGQPDGYSGELPCAYVELKEGATATAEELKAFAAEHVGEQAARPAHVEIVSEMPVTTVGKIFKPALRRKAIARVFQETLERAGVAADVDVIDDPSKGLTALIRPRGAMDERAVRDALSGFTRPWRFAHSG